MLLLLHLLHELLLLRVKGLGILVHLFLLVEVLLKHQLVEHHLLLSLLLRLETLELHRLLSHQRWTLFLGTLQLLHIGLDLVHLVIEVAHQHIVILVKSLRALQILLECCHLLLHILRHLSLLKSHVSKVHEVLHIWIEVEVVLAEVRLLALELLLVHPLGLALIGHFRLLHHLVLLHCEPDDVD